MGGSRGAAIRAIGPRRKTGCRCVTRGARTRFARVDFVAAPIFWLPAPLSAIRLWGFGFFDPQPRDKDDDDVLAHSYASHQR